jgi:hypothetical protein
MSGPDHTRRLLEALYAIESAIKGCPAGARRKAAIELVVERVRRLAGPRRRVQAETADAEASMQMDIDELLGNQLPPATGRRRGRGVQR